MADPQSPHDPFEMFRRLWGPLGIPLPGMTMPTLDPGEIEKRIAELKAVEGWLSMNLNMLRMAIQGLEMQKAALEAMRATGAQRIVFASTGSIYGEASVIPTPERAPFTVQTSLYGASKLAGEGLIQAYCEGFGFQSWIFRFVSILGERYTHGHVVDFYRSLRADPSRLRVLGNGRQRKSYLYVQDCIDAILVALDRATEKVNVLNLGTEECCEVNDSIEWIIRALGVSPILDYTGGDRGWIGDNPFIFLDTTRIRALGWKPKLTIREGILRTLDYLRSNEWVLSGR